MHNWREGGEIGTVIYLDWTRCERGSSPECGLHDFVVTNEGEGESAVMKTIYDGYHSWFPLSYTLSGDVGPTSRVAMYGRR